MAPEITAALIGGVFLLVATAIGGLVVNAHLERRKRVESTWGELGRIAVEALAELVRAIGKYQRTVLRYERVKGEWPSDPALPNHGRDLDVQHAMLNERLAADALLLGPRVHALLRELVQLWWTYENAVRSDAQFMGEAKSQLNRNIDHATNLLAEYIPRLEKAEKWEDARKAFSELRPLTMVIDDAPPRRRIRAITASPTTMGERTRRQKKERWSRRFARAPLIVGTTVVILAAAAALAIVLLLPR